MLIYIIFILLIFILPILGKINITKGVRIYGFTAAFILIFIFCALRFDVGYDYEMYHMLIDGDIKYYTAKINRIEYLPRQLILFSRFIGFYQFFSLCHLLLLFIFIIKQ